MYHSTRGKSTGQLVFDGDSIIPINHGANWRYICQLEQAQINKDVICRNTTLINHDHIVGDKFITRTKSAYKIISPFKGQCEF